MTLRFKVFIIVGTVLVSFFFLVSQSLSYFIARDFSLLEKQEVERNVFRVVDALENRINELSVKLSDWSKWDDTYSFIQDQNEEYITSNLQNESFGLLRIDTVVIMDLEGQVIFKKHVQDNQEGAVSDVFLSHLLSDITKGHISREEKEGHGEIIMLPEGPLMYVTRPVISGNGLSPANGYIAFGYFLNQEVIDEISRVTHLKIQPVLYDDQSMNGEFSFLWKQFSNEEKIFY
jgi:sensor domain CHASE-containing protein